MGKYLATIENSMKKSLAYRADTFIRMLAAFFSFVVLFFLWTTIYGQGNQIGNYSLAQIITYYVFVAIFELLIMSLDVSWGIGEEIKNGQIVGSILKPINYLKYKFAQAVGGLIYRLIIFVPPLLLAVFLLKNYLTRAESMVTYVIFAAIALVSFVLYFLIYFIAGVISFWTVDYHGPLYTFFTIVSFMQGTLLPLDLMPRWLLAVSQWLPFKFLFFVPVSFVTGRLSFTWSIILIPLGWCVGLSLLGWFLYLRGVKRYESYGI